MANFRDVRGKETDFWGAYDFSCGIVDSSGGIVRSMGAGSTYIAEFNSLGVGGWLISATTDYIQTFKPVPKHWNVNRSMRWRAHFGHSATGADTPTVMLSWKKNADSTAGTFTSPDTSTTAAKTCSTTNHSYQQTAWKALPANTFTYNAPYIWGVNFASLGSASANEIYLLGIEFEFYPTFFNIT